VPATVANAASPSWSVSPAETECAAIFSDDAGVRHPRIETRRLDTGVAEPFLQSELAHPGFPHPDGVRMAQCVRAIDGGMRRASRDEHRSDRPASGDGPPPGP
jgi:hypothetical protein